MLIKLDWSTGSLIREYTVHLEPPNEQFYSQRCQKYNRLHLTVLNSTKPDLSAAKQLDSVIENLSNKKDSVSNKLILEQRQEEAELSEAKGLTETVKSEPKIQVTTYGPVRNSDTLFRTAQKETSYHVQLNQLLIALYRANPQAFSDNNINLLKAGHILRIPNESEVATIAPDVADKEVKIHTEN